MTNDFNIGLWVEDLYYENNSEKIALWEALTAFRTETLEWYTKRETYLGRILRHIRVVDSMN